MAVGEKQEWLRRELDRRDWSPAELARRAQPFADAAGYAVKFNQQLIWNFLNTAKKMPGWFRFAEDALRHEGRGSIAVPDRPPTRDASAGETVGIARMDLSLAMGPGTNIDDYIEVDTVEFDLGLLRSMTPSAPTMLRLVSGAGDSMFPTLLDTDLMFIDTGQRVLNMQDRIWAISLYGAGALKRLRAIGKGKVLVISDNPAIDDQEVDAEDISIAGRLVGAFRRH